MIELVIQEGLQNVYAPIPFKYHAIFCILATIILIFQFIRRNRICYLFFTLAVDATLVSHYALGHEEIMYGLAAFEVLMLAMCIVDICISSKKRKELEKEEIEKERQEIKEQKERESSEKFEDKTSVDNAFSDDDLDNLEK